MCIRDRLTAQAEKLQFLIASLVKAGRLETGAIEVHPKEASVQALVSAALREATPKAAEKGVAFLAPPDTAAAARFEDVYKRQHPHRTDHAAHV